MTAYHWLDDAMTQAIRIACRTSIRRKIRSIGGLFVITEVGS